MSLIRIRARAVTLTWSHLRNMLFMLSLTSRRSAVRWSSSTWSISSTSLLCMARQVPWSCSNRARSSWCSLPGDNSVSMSERIVMLVWVTERSLLIFWICSGDILELDLTVDWYFLAGDWQRCSDSVNSGLCLTDWLTVCTANYLTTQHTQGLLLCHLLLISLCSALDSPVLNTLLFYWNISNTQYSSARCPVSSVLYTEFLCICSYFALLITMARADYWCSLPIYFLRGMQTFGVGSSHAMPTHSSTA